MAVGMIVSLGHKAQSLRIKVRHETGIGMWKWAWARGGCGFTGHGQGI